MYLECSKGNKCDCTLLVTCCDPSSPGLLLLRRGSTALDVFLHLGYFELSLKPWVSALLSFACRELPTVVFFPGCVQALNALNNQLVNELCHVMEAFDKDPGIGAMVLTGSDRAFAGIVVLVGDAQKANGTSATGSARALLRVSWSGPWGLSFVERSIRYLAAP